MGYICQTEEGRPTFEVVAEDVETQRDAMNADSFLQDWISTDASHVRHHSTTQGACDTKTAYYQAAFYAFAAARLAAGNGLMSEAEQFYGIGMEAQQKGDDEDAAEDGWLSDYGSQDAATISAIQQEYYQRLFDVCSSSSARNCMEVISWPLTALNTVSSTLKIQERQKEIEETKTSIDAGEIVSGLYSAGTQSWCVWRFVLSGFFIPTRPGMCGYKKWQIYLLRAGILGVGGALIYSRIALAIKMAKLAGDDDGILSKLGELFGGDDK